MTTETKPATDEEIAQFLAAMEGDEPESEDAIIRALIARIDAERERADRFETDYGNVITSAQEHADYTQGVIAETDHVNVRMWTKRGDMLVRTTALSHDDPDHPYNQITAQGLKPEDYGVEHPLEQRFKGQTRGQLISRIVELEAEIDACMHWGHP